MTEAPFAVFSRRVHLKTDPVERSHNGYLFEWKAVSLEEVCKFGEVSCYETRFRIVFVGYVLDERMEQLICSKAESEVRQDIMQEYGAQFAFARFHG
jgi:hypothetical protein